MEVEEFNGATTNTKSSSSGGGAISDKNRDQHKRMKNTENESTVFIQEIFPLPSRFLYIATDCSKQSHHYIVGFITYIEAKCMTILAQRARRKIEV